MAVTEIKSILPLLVTAIPVVFSIPIFFIRGRKAFREWLAIGGIAVTLMVTVLIYLNVVVAGEVRALVWQDWFYVDGLSVLMEFIVAVMGIIIVLYSMKYIAHEEPKASQGKLSLYYGLLLLFMGIMNWTCATNSLITLYVTLELGTVATTYLVAFDWRRRSLEAGYKYLLLITVGVVFSLLGGVLLYSAAGSKGALSLNELGKVAPQIPHTIALVCCGLFIAGFGTKAGLIPFHAWLPDAHAEAPAPISVLLSGVIINMGAYSLVRTVTVFAPLYHEVVLFMAIIGSVTMVLGILMALVQDDLKRLLAFSSVSEMGFIVTGLGLGTYLGIYGGLFHMVNHSIMKGLLFFCSGALLYATGTRKISELRLIPKKMLITSFCFIVAALAIGGMPPFNGFMSELALSLALGQAGLLWAAIILIIAGFLTLVALIWAGYRIFWTKPNPELAPAKPRRREAKEVPALMWGGMIFLAILCVLFGVYSQAVYPLLNSAANGVAAILPAP
jgi:hydrogenase-4 component F